MKKRIVIMLLALVVTVSGCGLGGASGSSAGNGAEQPANGSGQNLDQNSAGASGLNTETVSQESNQAENTAAAIGSTLLGDTEEIYYDVNLVPSVPSYKVADDLSNLVYDENFAYYFDPQYQSEYNDVEGFTKLIKQNGFAVKQSYGDEFFDIYESNRYMQYPSFITVDSLMHTYHLYFADLMEKTEKNYLADSLNQLTAEMLEVTLSQYQELTGTQWESAALRNLTFFYVASLLNDENAKAPVDNADLISVAEQEFGRIMAAEGIDTCLLTGEFEDYTQYKVRGYYEGSEELQKYFRTMMWYGRLAFDLEKEDAVKSAILMNMAISQDAEKWNSIYAITSFFAGSSDDVVYPEMSVVLDSVYGNEAGVKEIAADEASFAAVMEAVKNLKIPQINSIPVMEGEEAIIPSYRFMGQRFTIDAAIMQRLVTSAVKENSNGEKRYLPDVLDVPAALGSETALEILTEIGATDYQGYTDNLQIAKAHFDNDDPKLWNASLYSGWLNVLRPLLEEKGDGYPSYKTNKEWGKKALETFAGSFAELKHDTILYAKQIYAEMGGGDQPEIDDRGYVDPEPVVYSRFAFLSNKTKEGLEAFGMITETQKEDLSRLSEIALTLLSISEKELKNEMLTDDDYEFIRCYGGYLEHFWLEINREKYGDFIDNSYQAPCPVIADIATDPNGSVLEVGSGKVSTVYVVFPIDGELHVGRGSAYSFYQFTQPMSDRLTDTQWCNMLSGGYLDDDFNWIEVENTAEQPEWTQSYRSGY